DMAFTGADGRRGVGMRVFGPSRGGRDPVLAGVVRPAGQWRIEAVPHGGWARDGLSVWLLRAVIVLAGGLVLLPVFVTARMVNERHRYIGQLRNREAVLAQLTHRLNLALDASKIGVWEMDLSRDSETWDARTHELYGRLPDGQPRTHADWRAAVHPDDRERAERSFRDMIPSGRYECDYRVLLPDGTVRHVR